MTTNEEQQDLCQVALDCYYSAILAMAACLEVACPPAGAHHRDQLMRIRQRLVFSVTPETLREAQDALERELSSFSERSHRYCELKVRDVETVLQLLGEAMAYDPEGRLHDRIQDVYDRVLETEQVLIVDPLTGLPSRRELSQELATRITARRQFCLMFFDVDDFKRLNHTLGADAGDQVLKQMARGLKQQVRTRDFVCRWKDDEFLVIIESGLGNASARTNQILQFLRGPYTLTDEGREYKLEITVTGGVVEHAPGETGDQVVARVLAQVADQRRPAVA